MIMFGRIHAALTLLGHCVCLPARTCHPMSDNGTLVDHSHSQEKTPTQLEAGRTHLKNRNKVPAASAAVY
ncbi:hypothetical protein AV530_008905 [Patagioenas fasciata monilis]|uniref:Secreted protein n=1 Tax=Patagioenas fasciata monilis TaxID=372326 RepID=A0A1V4JF38_PATFA|nr:hypothetical protein AV530_008905 [Patagioenas fasciata monilis]